MKNRILTHHDNDQKAGSAAFMLFGTFSDIFHIQHHTVLNAVDAFMFCAMIHKGTAGYLPYWRPV